MENYPATRVQTSQRILDVGLDLFAMVQPIDEYQVESLLIFKEEFVTSLSNRTARLRINTDF